MDEKIDDAAGLLAALADEEVAERLHMLLSLTLAHLCTGRPPAAHEAVQPGLEIARRTGQGLLAPAFVCMRGFVAYELGRIDPAEADAEEALEAAMISGNVPVAYWASIQCSWIALARGKPDGAIVHGQAAWDLLGAHAGSQAGFSVADARLAAGDPAGALAAAARCRTLSAEALVVAGQAAQARTHARRAAAELGACGAWGYRDAALRVLRRLGDRPRPVEAGPRADGRAADERLRTLTAREREVAALLGAGETNAQIAHRLHLISSPDQLGPAVVTAPKIATDAVTTTHVLDHTISQRDERNPSLRAKVRTDGVVLAGDVPGNARHVSGTNRYDIVFSSGDLGPNGLDVCGFSASPWFDLDLSSGHRALRAYVNHAPGAATIQVFTFEERADGFEHATEADFDVVAAC